MPNESEQRALSQIKDFLEAGHSLDALRQSGWGDWIDHLEGEGYDLRTGKLALRPPEDTPVPGPIPASDERAQATEDFGTPLTSDTKGGPFELVTKPIRAWWEFTMRHRGWNRVVALGAPLLTILVVIIVILAAIGGSGDGDTDSRGTGSNLIDSGDAALETTSTAAEVAIGTPEPTATRGPTRTAGPTSTPRPTKTPRPTVAPPYKLALISASCTTRSDIGFSECEGFVKNISGRSLENVEVVVTWVDQNGTPQSTDEALIDFNPVLAGQESPWSTIGTYNPALTRFRVQFKELLGGSILTRDDRN